MSATCASGEPCLREDDWGHPCDRDEHGSRAASCERTRVAEPTTTAFERAIERTMANVRRAHEQSARRIPTEVLRAELTRRGEPCEACGILLAPCGLHS